MADLRFDGRVALVTGAGGSIGRAHAMLLASRGAKIVVNDYNTSVSGEAGTAQDNPGERVAKELRALGTDAVVNTDSVADLAGAQRMVDQAFDEFGRLDIIINNAGIAVCDNIHEEPGPKYERNLNILLEGPMYVVRAAWERMKAQKFGRILNTSSASIFGFNQPDGNWWGSYVLAKSAITAYTRQLGGYGEQFGIKANAILPLAYSRMNWDLLKGTPEGDFLEKYATPESVAAASGYLLHEECPVSGASFSVSGGRIARVVYAEPLGHHSHNLTPELVKANWAAVMGEVSADYKMSDFYEIPNLLQESLLMLQAGVGKA
ncbi:MAG: SDR family NAD(P)-dependent oxidoreductase [Rhodocyclaceae bacterium]|nr:SDR family NAD(P)-dependent oxidoreductase [Rhodocyclaceae bacterium]